MIRDMIYMFGRYFFSFDPILTKNYKFWNNKSHSGLVLMKIFGRKFSFLVILAEIGCMAHYSYLV